jgi:sulfhydrogenase subunit beta (sulfur reductase)
MVAGPDTGFLRRARFQDLIDALRAAGYRCLLPAARDGAVVFAEAQTPDHLPCGVIDRQAPGQYRLEAGPAQRWFAWSNGPQALKPLVFPAQETLWTARRDDEGLVFAAVPVDAPPTAVIGVRACDLAALRLQEQHFGAGADAGFAARRAGLLLVGVACSEPATTCFCASTGDGPALREGAAADYDLGLTELDDGFLVRAGSVAGRALYDGLALEPPGADRLKQGQRQADQARARQTRRLPPEAGLRQLYARLDHPRWDAVAARCLSCGNCTAVCPTCFCSAYAAQAELEGGKASQVRRWDSCFSDGHSLLHGHPLRAHICQRYRQWLTHKLAGWQSQFGRSGCVGCGRCISWCPVGIDLTEEVAALLGEGGDG